MASKPIAVFVTGTPVPKGRPRVVKGHTFTPQRTKDWEAVVRLRAMVVMKNRKPLEGFLRVALAFSGARANADLDNLAKSVLDAGNKVLWVDDKQIVDLHIIRIHGDPGVLIEVWPKENDE